VAQSILLDTCAALWLIGGAPMTEASRAAIRSASAANAGIYVSPFMAWEIGTLVAKQRLPLALSPEVWFESLLAQPGVRLAPLTPQILLASTTLPGAPPSDPADRIIIATARLYGFQLNTRDKKILQYAKQGHVLATAC
jgi:PIN domain nuclease of toxin-antitoxin system